MTEALKSTRGKRNGWKISCSAVVCGVLTVFVGHRIQEEDRKTSLQLPAGSVLEKERDGPDLPGEANRRNEVADAAPRVVRKLPVLLREKAAAPAPLVEILTGETYGIEERVRKLHQIRGTVPTVGERAAAMAFLSGKNLPPGMPADSIHWLADELLTSLRLQEPPWEDLAAELGTAAFQPSTDPVVRDYIMQHLGHLWEQRGARKEIEESLWKAVGTRDDTTPATALIALNGGYGRDGRPDRLEEVRSKALALEKDASTPLAVRATALAIAGEGRGEEVERLADNLIRSPGTPFIIKKVAENIAR